MFSSSFAYLDETENLSNNNLNNNSKTNKQLQNKTKKRKLTKEIKKNNKVENFITSLRETFSDSDSDDDLIFNKEQQQNQNKHFLPNPILQSQKNSLPISKQNYKDYNEINNKLINNDNNSDKNSDIDDNDITKEEFTNYLQGETNNINIPNENHPSNHWIPYFTQATNQRTANLEDINQSELLNKLNYLIHMMEQQKEEKTGHVTEELILYSFLGVFMIFIVDSFTKVSKYSR